MGLFKFEVGERCVNYTRAQCEVLHWRWIATTRVQVVGASSTSAGEDEHQVRGLESRRSASDAVDPSLWQPVHRGPAGCPRCTGWRHWDDRVRWPQRKAPAHHPRRKFLPVSKAGKLAWKKHTFLGLKTFKTLKIPNFSLLDCLFLCNLIQIVFNFILLSWFMSFAITYKNDVTERIVYRMFFIGHNVVSGVRSPLSPLYTKT